jgi:hypothetical protein
VAAAALVVGLVGCGGEGAHVDGLFQVAASPVTLTDESPGLQFFAKTTKDVDIFKVVITAPTGTELLLEGKNNTFYEGQVISLQDDDEAFIWITGQWTFRFVGKLSRGGQESFDVIETVKVSL